MLKNILNYGIKNADDLARVIMPAVLQMDNPALVNKALSGLRRMGANVGNLADDLIPTSVAKRVPARQAPRPEFGRIGRNMGEGLIGESPQVVNRQIARTRATQAPPPEFDRALPDGARPDTVLNRMGGRVPMGPNPATPTRGIEGTQLRFPLTQPGKGSRTYSPMKSSGDPDNVRISMGRTLANESAQEAAEGLAREAAESGLTRGPGRYNMGSAADEIQVFADQMRNAAGGNQFVDLNLLGKLGLGAGGIAALIGGMNQDQTGETTARVSAPVTPFLRENDGTPLGEAPSELVPTNPPSVGNIDPTPPALISQNTNNEALRSEIRSALAQSDPMAAEIVRATEPLSPEKYATAAEYFAAREAYTNQADVRRQINDMMAVRAEGDPGLQAWAQNFPQLAYELQRHANQQSAETRTTTVTNTELGSDLGANALGNAEAAGEAGVNPTQGAFDMEAATRPITQDALQRVNQYMSTFGQYPNFR